MEVLPTEMTMNDRLLFRTFFENTYPRVKAYLYSLLGTNMHVEDIAQEAYIKLWNNWERLDKELQPDSYFFTIVRNTVISHFRREQQQRLQLPVTPVDTGRHESAEKLFYKGSLHLYEAVLRQVALVKQRCFRLHREYGLTHQQIALREGISTKTVERYIREILQLLQTAMKFNYLFLLIINLPLP